MVWPGGSMSAEALGWLQVAVISAGPAPSAQDTGPP